MENVDLKAQIQENIFENAALKNELRKLKGKTVIDTVVSKPHATTIAPGMFKLDLEPLALKVLKNKDAHLNYIKNSREHKDTLWEIVKSARALSPLDSNLDSTCKYVQRIQKVLVYVRDTCPCLTRPSDKLVYVTPKNKDKKVRFADPVTSSSNTQKQVDSYKPKDSNQLYSGCSKHMTKYCSQLINFVNKYLGIVKFGNDQIVKTICYGDYQIGNVTISRVYYGEGLRHNLFFVGQFCDSDLEVAFRKHTCFVHNLEGMFKLDLEPLASKVLKNKDAHLNYIKNSKEHADTLQKIVKSTRALSTLDSNLDSTFDVTPKNKDKKVIFADLVTSSSNTKKQVVQIVLWYLDSECSKHMIENHSKLTNFVNKFLGTVKFEAVATTCYTQNHSLICLRHGKTPYKLLHDRKPNLSYLHVFGALCYPTNDNKDLGKLKAKVDVGIYIRYAPAKKAYLIYNRHTRRIMETIHVDFDELIAMASEQSSSRPALNEITPATPCSGLTPKLTSPTLPPPCVDHHVLEVAALEPAVSTGTPSSTLVNQDAPSLSNSQTLQESPSLTHGTEEANHDIKVAHTNNNPYFGILIPKPSSEESSSHVVIPNNVHSVNQPPEHISKWTKDHSMDNVISDPSRPVSTLHQLQNKAMFYYFDAFLSSVDPKSYKEALTKSY
nr:retrovirus-related Pol polyprotein from transposon TNT 1-94 [Tanacetum cinerariifolium]